VALTVSKGVQPVTVPNVVGQTQAAASTTITGASLTVGTITQVFDPTVASGTVISQTPAAGGSVAPGTAVALTVSKGVQPVTVPNVVGQTQAAASTTITGASLTVGTITQAFSATVPSGTVISQTPTAGGSVAPGTAVALTVSKGVQPVTVPNVVGQTQAAASTQIVGATLVVGTVTQEYNATVLAGTVISQTPSAGSSVAPGTAVLLSVSKGVQPVITGSVIINRGARSTSSTSVSLNLTWSSNAVRMRFSDNGATWTPWESLRATRSFILPAGDGYKTVRVQFIDIANNESDRYSDYILLDTAPPTGSVTINNGASATAGTNVTLSLTWSDGTGGSGVAQMRFSDDGATWTLWEPVAATKAFTLPGPVGSYNTVRVQYHDAAGNYSAVFNDYIRVEAI
jgi:beta-lactam-binding protein with PASTA domain